MERGERKSGLGMRSWEKKGGRGEGEMGGVIEGRGDDISVDGGDCKGERRTATGCEKKGMLVSGDKQIE